MSTASGYIAARLQQALLHARSGDLTAAEAVYEEYPGWRETTVGITHYDALPLNARRYLERL